VSERAEMLAAALDSEWRTTREVVARSGVERIADAAAIHTLRQAVRYRLAEERVEVCDDGVRRAFWRRPEPGSEPSPVSGASVLSRRSRVLLAELDSEWRSTRELAEAVGERTDRVGIDAVRRALARAVSNGLADKRVERRPDGALCAYWRRREP